MRMVPEEFYTWSQHLQFTSETETLIAGIRSSHSVRRATGHPCLLEQVANKFFHDTERLITYKSI